MRFITKISFFGSAAIVVALFSSEALAAEGGLKGGGTRKQQREHLHHHDEDSEMIRHLQSNGPCADIYACGYGAVCVETPGEAAPYTCTCEPGTEQFTDENGKIGCHFPCDNRAGECPADSHCRQKQVPDASGVLTWTLDCTCNYGWLPREDENSQLICMLPCDVTPCTVPTTECSNHINWTSPTLDAYTKCTCPAGLSPVYDNVGVHVACGDCGQTCPTGSSCKASGQGYKCQCDEPLMWNETDASGNLVRCALPCEIASCPYPEQTCRNMLLETMYGYNCDCPAGQSAVPVTVDGRTRTQCIWPCDVVGACPTDSTCANTITPEGTPWKDCTCKEHYTPKNNEWGYLDSCTLDTCKAHEAVGVDACPPNAKCTDKVNTDGTTTVECECEPFFKKELDANGKWTSCEFVPTCTSVQNACGAKLCVPAFADGSGIDCLECYFCDKYLDTMYITLSHNAFAVDGTVQFPNQKVDEAQQFIDGVRGLNFDVYNDPAELLSSDTNIRSGEIYMMHGKQLPPAVVASVKPYLPSFDPNWNPKVSYNTRVQAVRRLLEDKTYRTEILIVRFQFELKKTESSDIQKLVEPWGDLVIKNFDSNKDFRHYIEKNQRVLLLTKQHANPAIGLHDSHKYIKASKGSWKHWTDKPKMSQKDPELSNTSGHRFARMMSYHTGVLGTTLGNWHGSSIVNVKERILFHVRDFFKEAWTNRKINILNVDYHTAGKTDGGLYGVFAAQKAIRAGNTNEGCWENGRGCNWGPDESTCFYCCSDSTSDADVLQGALDLFTKGKLARKCG